VQLTAPKAVSAATPRTMPPSSVALEPVVQEATIHYGKPLRGSPTPMGATYNREAVSSELQLLTCCCLHLLHQHHQQQQG
jgi:hypothetical protein